MTSSAKTKRTVFFGILILTFIAVFIYNYLTPLLSDDLIYQKQIEGSGFFDLFRFQYREYFTNNARFFDLLTMRFFLMGNKMFFNIFNSLLFVGQLVLLYLNIDKRKKYDIPLLLLLDSFLWLFSVDFGQTNLWLCGACNYLLSSVLLLGNLTLIRHIIKKDLSGNLSDKNIILKAVGIFLFAMLGSWCSETLGAATLLLVVIFSLIRYFKDSKGQRKIRYYMISSVLGLLAGSVMILISPGVHSRAAVLAEDESYTGLLAYVSRFYKVTVNIYNTFLILLIMMVLIFVYLAVKKKLSNITTIIQNESVIFFIGFLAACYVLILIAPPMHRAYYGAALYLMIAVGYGFSDIVAENDAIAFIKYSLVSILTMLTLFVFVDNFINLKVIHSDEAERNAVLEQAVAEGRTDEYIKIPIYHTGYDTPYSVAYLSDITDDPEYWMNLAYSDYYGVKGVIGVPYEEWEEMK